MKFRLEKGHHAITAKPMSLTRIFLILCGFSAGFFLGLSDAIAVIKSIDITPHCADNMALVDQASLNPDATQIDRIVVSKQRRKLYLLKNGELVKSYTVAFGFGASNGPKIKQGDGRTPEGLYQISLKNPQSKYYKALRVSYPNKKDTEFASKLNVSPGGDIMIHGFPRGFIDNLIPEVVKAQHPQADWTQGCIAVTNEEIDQIYKLTAEKVPLEICPL